MWARVRLGGENMVPLEGWSSTGRLPVAGDTDTPMLTALLAVSWLQPHRVSTAKLPSMDRRCRIGSPPNALFRRFTRC